MKPSAKIYLAGHRGVLGAAIERRLEALGCRNILTRTHAGSLRRWIYPQGPRDKRAMAQWNNDESRSRSQSPDHGRDAP